MADQKSWLQKYWKSLLVVILCIAGDFGGIFCLIHAENVSAHWANFWYWTGGIALGAFTLFFGIWFFFGGRNNS